MRGIHPGRARILPRVVLDVDVLTVLRREVNRGRQVSNNQAVVCTKRIAIDTLCAECPVIDIDGQVVIRVGCQDAYCNPVIVS